VTDAHFRNRVWCPAIKAAGIRRFPPRIMRHTAASWLVQDGVPLYDVQALLGHEDYATTSGTRTWRRTRTGRYWSRGHGAVAHQWRTTRRRAVPRDGKQPSDVGRGGRI
jgi:integrase